MIKITNLCLLVLFSMAAHAQNIQCRLDSLTEFYRETFDFNGTVLVTQHDKPLVNKGYGYQDRANNIKNTPNSIYLIGSVTKQFTAEVVLMLAQEGKLSVSDKLSRYFPRFTFADSVTLEQMLTHTSGIFDYTQNEQWQKGKLDTPISDKDIFAMISNMPLQFTPGSKWDYSNSNYKLLGSIIEQLTGKTYYQNVHERIFTPLGMRHSGFDITHLKSPDKTVGYYRVRNDSFLVSVIVDSTQTNSAGSIYSTTGDLEKWHHALQHYTLLPKEWQDKAFKPFKQHYGYGWTTDSIAGRLVSHHSGYIHGYNSNFYHIKDDDVCIVILTNLMKTGADPVQYARDIVRAMYEKSYAIPAVRRPARIAEGIQQRYVGDYIFTEDSSLVFNFKITDHKPYLQLTGQPAILLLPQSPIMFFTKVVDAQVEFKKKGEEYYMLLYQNGNVLQANKKKG